ncbi:hypothetical protein M427DRAFT_67415 [Gonapodya prolifera JEL478]|uniref:HAT C-terminal dimerisation domain-containing protein n=1 Tax=Gonapodya prolifera (strain JEL478) TaxID=1344416 RepID=A0A139APX5_GONPJ|nr:hypothetical protein M427DRAFT_67415 [Gonapodya prolifera JEL478]|eukprot:KXS18778.1 hypothetical protein M427DRAFT_67415 [Gonapodya prolifera JEL478]
MASVEGVILELLKHLRELVAPVETRWCSDYNANVWVLADHIEINKLIAKENVLWKWKLTDVDWEYLKHMKALLMKVEAAKIRTLYMVVPVFNLVMDSLEYMDFGGEQCLEDTRSIILSKLQTYYRKTDDSLLYMLSVVLHPLLKLRWMVEETWEQEFIGQARELLQGELDRVAPSGALITPQGKPGFLDNNLEMEFLGKGDTQGEMEQYLEEPQQGKDQNVLEYWRSRNGLPGLQWIARTIIGVPGSSAESERIFSASKEVIGDRRRPHHSPPNIFMSLQSLPRELLINIYNLLSNPGNLSVVCKAVWSLAGQDDTKAGWFINCFGRFGAVYSFMYESEHGYICRPLHNPNFAWALFRCGAVLPHHDVYEFHQAEQLDRYGGGYQMDNVTVLKPSQPVMVVMTVEGYARYRDKIQMVLDGAARCRLSLSDAGLGLALEVLTVEFYFEGRELDTFRVDVLGDHVPPHRWLSAAYWYCCVNRAPQQFEERHSRTLSAIKSQWPEAVYENTEDILTWHKVHSEAAA